jgi:hypothetical protein
MPNLTFFNLFCRFKLHFNENGKYQLNVSAEGEDKLVSCSLHQENADTSHDANTR